MAKKQSKLEHKLNEISRVAFLDENGRPKSAAWLYSFMIGLAFTVLYAVVFIGSGLLLSRLFDEASFGVIALQYLFTAVVGSIPGILLAWLLKEDRKALIWYAYIWMAVLLILTVPATLMMSGWKDGYGWTDMWLFCVYLYFPALLSLLAGGFPVRALWRKEQERMTALEEKANSRPSYYRT